jgi:WD40 repeat protein
MPLLSGIALGQPQDKNAESANVGNRDSQDDPLPRLAIARLGSARWQTALREWNGSADVGFSPDGKLVIGTGDALFCRFCPCDASTGKEVSWFPKDQRIEVGVFAPDGKTLITCEDLSTNRGSPRVIKHWEVGTGRILREVKIKREQGRDQVPALSSDGTLLLCCDNKKLRMLDTTTGEPVYEIPQEPLPNVAQYALSADKKTLAMMGSDGRLYVFDVVKGKELNRFERAEDGSMLFWPVLSPDGKTLIASTQTSLRVWDLSSGTLRHEISGCRGPVAFTADGKYMACGDSKAIHLWEVDSLRKVRRFEEHGEFIHEHGGIIYSLAFAKDGKQIVSAGDHSITCWDVASGKRLNQVSGHKGHVFSLTFSADNRSLASGGFDGSALVWDVRNGKVCREFIGHDAGAISLAFSPDGKTLATGDGFFGNESGYEIGSESQVRLWNLETGALRRQFTGHLTGVVDLSFSPDGKMLASAGHDARARMWDARDGKRLYQIRGSDGRRIVAFSADGKTLLIGNYGGELALWNAKTGENLRELSSPDDKLQAANRIDQQRIPRNPRRNVRRCVLHTRFLESGKVVSIEANESGAPATVRIWNAESGQEERSFLLNGSNNLHAYAVSFDGATVATATPGQTNDIHLWDCEKGELLITLSGHTEYVGALAFSPDGKTLASGGHDTKILLWDIQQIRLLDAWRSLAGGKDEAAQSMKTMVAHPEGTVSFLKDRLRKAATMESAYARTILHLGDNDFDVREKASSQLEAAGADAELALRLALEVRPSAEAQRRIEVALEKITGEREQVVHRLLADVETERVVSWDAEKEQAALRRLRSMGRSAEPILRRVLEMSAPIPLDRAHSPGDRFSARTVEKIRRILADLKPANDATIDQNAAGAFRSLAVLAQIGTPDCRQILEALAKGPAEGVLTAEAKTQLGRLDKR